MSDGPVYACECDVVYDEGGPCGECGRPFRQYVGRQVGKTLIVDEGKTVDLPWVYSYDEYFD